MSCSTNSPKHRRFSKKRGKSCDSRDPQRVLGLDLGEQTLNAKGAGLHGCWSSRAQRLSCREQPRASNPRICTADHLPPRAAGMPTAGEARPRPFRGKRRRGVKARGGVASSAWDSSPLSRYPVEAKGLSLPFGALPRMGQKEEPGCVGSDAGGRGGLELTRCPNNPEHDCRHEAHGLAPSGIASRFNLSLTVRSGTTRVQHRTMAEFTSARSGIDSPVKPMDRWAEPLRMCARR
jgi:hypothetical protein